MSEQPTGSPSPGGEGASSIDEGSFIAEARGPTRIALIVLAVVGGLATFVAAVGGAIVWVRFYAAELPAEDILAALPREQLVASGGITLAAFVLLGIVAVVGVHLFEDGLPHEGYRQRQVIRGLLTLATVESLVVVALAMGTDRDRRFVAAEAIVLFAMLILLLIRWRETFLRKGRKRPWQRLTGILIATASLGAAGFAAGLEIAADSQGTEASYQTQQIVLAVALLFVGTVICIRWILYGFDEPQLRDPNSKLAKKVERDRRLGKLGIQLLSALAIAFSWLILGHAWIAVTLGAVMLIGVGSWRVAKRAKYEFTPRVIVALFVSVPVLGAVAGITRNFADPQVQPMALIRAGDAATEAVQGIYVTETDDRVYFASVSTRGCTNHIDQNSGRLLWVPRDEVVAMSLGPAQDVKDAGRRAIELHHALVPAEAGALSGFARKPQRRPTIRRRLENPGPAVRGGCDQTHPSLRG